MFLQGQSLISVPVCNRFKANILNDQTCYEIDVNDHIDPQKIADELDIGLTILLDYNEDKAFVEKDISQNLNFVENIGKTSAKLKQNP